MTHTEPSSPGVCQVRAGLTLPRAYRLSRKDEFDFVLKSPDRRLNRGALRAYVRANGLAHARLGIIVGRRASPLAVERNRVKRATRESFRLRARELGAVDVVVQLVSSPSGNEARDLAALWDRLAPSSSTDAPSS